MGRQRPAVVDANVLIDYAGRGLPVVADYAATIRPLLVPVPILDEVGLSETDCSDQGILPVEPTTEQLLAAGSRRGGLSFNDRLCLIIAGVLPALCVTNDRALRRECEAEGLSVRWGLELMIELVAAGQLAVSDAQAVAEEVHENNPLHIHRQILDRSAVVSGRLPVGGRGAC